MPCQIRQWGIQGNLFEQKPSLRYNREYDFLIYIVNKLFNWKRIVFPIYLNCMVQKLMLLDFKIMKIELIHKSIFIKFSDQFISSKPNLANM